MDKLDKINQVRRLLWETHEILDELRKEAKGKVLDSRNEADLADVYILWAERDINGVQAKMDIAVEHIERQGEHNENTPMDSR